MATRHEEDRFVLARFIGQRILSLRRAKGWSQEKLAREVEMSRETIRWAESGKHSPEWTTLEKIAHALDVSSV